MPAHAAARPAAGSRRSARTRRRPGVRRAVFGAAAVAATATAAATLCAPAAWGAGPSTSVVAVGAQAEAFELDPSDGRAFDDARAARGKGLVVWSEGAAIGHVTALAESDRLRLRVRGDQCDGAPQVTVALDGQKVATVAVANRKWATVSLPGRWEAGEHQVALAFDNDFLSSSCDRNLRFDQISFNGGTTAAPPSSTPSATTLMESASMESASEATTTGTGFAARAASRATSEADASAVSTSPTSAGAEPPTVSSSSGTTTSAPASTTSTATRTAAAPTPPPAAAPSVSRTAAPSPAGTALSGARFWVDPDSDARRELSRRSGDASAIAALTKIADAPSSVWLGDWQSAGQAQARAQQVTASAAAVGQVPVLVLYAIPGRDCGGYSSGGLGSAEAYGAWVRAVAAGIGGRKAVVVVEPDALAQEGCLSESARGERAAMLRDAVTVLVGTGATTYLDGGHSTWVDAATMASRLKAAGVEKARGFALNVSNFNRTAAEEAYGEQVSSLLGGSHFVVDTSRNGNGASSGALAWCNPGGRAIGSLPTTSTAAAHADAYLWLKPLGQSDGDCGRGEPSAGTWWPEYAIAVARG